MNFEACKVNPYTFSFAIGSSCLRQTNAFEESVNKAQNTLFLSTAVYHFSNKAIVQEPAAEVFTPFLTKGLTTSQHC